MNERVREVRKAIGINQAEFGEALGVGVAAVSKIELGQVGVSRRHIEAICRVYHVSRHWLETGDGEMFYSDENTRRQLVEDLMEGGNINAKALFVALAGKSDAFWAELDDLIDRYLAAKQAYQFPCASAPGASTSDCDPDAAPR
jgi:transcriptional regulator with XRE-family HTH domain